MNERDAGFWVDVLNGLKAHWPQISGAIFAVAICYGRLIYDGAERKDHWIEPVLCGLLAWSASFGLELVGMSMSVAPFLGGVVGFLGVKKIRNISISVISKRVGAKDENQQ
ncbi:phage holin, lambda family [Serratia ureilytica]|uniref:phage holin, lambda family n=1 Tax=Serratia ureilytica TaxID=300181 RepID=UPI00313EC172